MDVEVRNGSANIEPTGRVSIHERKNQDLYKDEGSLLRKLHKAEKLPVNDKNTEDVTGDTPSNQGVSSGVRPHLINKQNARELLEFNPTHAVCIDAKVTSTLGLGHRDQAIHKTLDPLTRFSWQDVLTAAGQDYWEGGDAFIELVHDDDDLNVIVGINHIDAIQVHVEVEEQDNARDWHYVVQGEGLAYQTQMARFGDLKDMRERFNVTDKSVGKPNKESEGTGVREAQGSLNANDARLRRRSIGAVVNSSLIHIRQPTNRSWFYGFPDYLSATPSIELVQCMTQHEFDFFFNRGVPEFLLFLIGKNLGDKAWKQIEAMMAANRGLGNSHRTGAVHIPGDAEGIKVQVEKLAMDDQGKDAFADNSMALAMNIATAHGVPPILANILLPGKIGAANEGPNALLLFQKRKLGQAQKIFSAMFAQTLGSGIKLAQPEGKPKTLTSAQFLGETNKPKPNPMDPMSAMGATDENGQPIFLQPGNGFNTVLDGMTLGAQDTLSRMKEPLATSDRNPNDGLLGSGKDRKAGDRKKATVKPKPKK
jgi:hypothetical protein